MTVRLRRGLRLTAIALAAASFVSPPTLGGTLLPGPAPNPVTSEHFRSTVAAVLIATQSFDNDLDVISGNLTFTVHVEKPFDEPVLAEVTFERSAPGKPPIVVSRPIAHGLNDVNFLTELLPDLAISETYVATMRVYADETKRETLAEHVQPFNGASPQAIAWARAAKRNFTSTRCPLAPMAMAPPGWHVRIEQSGPLAGCYITKEEIVGPRGHFSTGVSVGPYIGKGDFDPNVEIDRLAANFAKTNKVLRVERDVQDSRYAAEFEVVAENMTPPTHVLNFFYLRKHWGGLSQIIAELPEETWSAEWPTLKLVMLSAEYGWFGLEAQSASPFDGEWFGKSSASVEGGRCGPGDLTMTVRDGTARGQTDNIVVELRGEQSDEALKKFVSCPHTGDVNGLMFRNFFRLTGPISASGKVSANGTFDGELECVRFTGVFRGDVFDGEFDPTLCGSKIRLDRTRRQ